VSRRRVDEVFTFLSAVHLSESMLGLLERRSCESPAKYTGSLLVVVLDMNNKLQTTARVSAPEGRFWMDKLVVVLLGVLALFLVAGSVQAVEDQEPVWELAKSKGGVKVVQTDVANSRFKATRGTLLSDAKLFDALAVLRDVEACKDWLHKCKYSEVISEVSTVQSIYYMVIDSPFVLKDRDTYVKSTIFYNAQEKAFHIDILGVEDMKPAHKKRVRVLGLTGSWIIEQRGPKQIQLIYEVHMDPQVSTASAANSTLATSVLETLINVDRLAKRAPYLNSTVSTDQLEAITRAPSGNL